MPENVMQSSVGFDALALARSRARKWLRIFQQLVRVLDRLEQQERSLLASALVFLTQKALGHLESTEPVGPVSGMSSSRTMTIEDDAAEASGDELIAAVDLARSAHERRDAREDPASDELEVLLVLAGALVEDPDGGSFGDFSVSTDDLVREYRALKQPSANDVMRVPLFPLGFRRRWSALMQAAATKDDPLRRLALELSVMKVIHALYAMAVGYRRAAAFDRPDPEGDAWLAYTLGEATLKSTRR
jgi:hypothetical protein